MAKHKRLHNYPLTSEVQRPAGYVTVKTRDGWKPRGRVRMAKWIGRMLEAHEKVYHKDGNPSNDTRENLVMITFCGAQYRLRESRAVYIPPTPVRLVKGRLVPSKERSGELVAI